MRKVYLSACRSYRGCVLLFSGDSEATKVVLRVVDGFTKTPWVGRELVNMWLFLEFLE
jgi:hypothetical protein